MTEIKDFTNLNKKANLEFKIDGDTFVAVGTAPAMAILDVGAVNRAQDLDKVPILLAFLDKVLLPESATRFAERLGSSEAPIDVDQAVAVSVWLMEEAYGPDRPTEAPSPSQNGSGSDGPSSTDGAPAPVSTRVL